ncbi:hypothetical protein D1AOALGA4SA_2295 [Olavius algarvensis Delta 1 endosymbiont]|nr:hypothetical protein D1AOALGA4SA_2295 [Olavius algarvensis Delta 1 endosymbiont]
MEKILSDWCDRSGHTVAFFLVIVSKKNTMNKAKNKKR